MKKKQLGQALGAFLLCVLLSCGLAAPAAAAGFADVPSGHWASQSISRCVQLGFFQGESTGRFGLGHPMTRAAFTVVLSRFFGWEIAKTAQTVYEDVPSGAWYAGAVQAAYDHGALTNQRAQFRPGDSVTREELAVMLVRALGYGTIAGLAQDLPSTFQDVTTNAGYITMVCDLGLMSGISAASFAPARTATREQVAVILMRLYDKLHSAQPGRAGVLPLNAENTALSGWDVIGIGGAQLTGAGGAQVTVSAEKAAAAKASAQAAGAKALLHVTGGVSALRAGAAETAACLAQAAGEWDGIWLDLPAPQSSQMSAFTSTVRALKTALGSKLLYVTVEAPSWQGTQYGGYDYAALAASADKLVLRIATYEKTQGTYPDAPVEPLEELYYALAELQGKVPAQKLSVLASAIPSVWVDGRKTDSFSFQALTQLTGRGKLTAHYSDRYACAYLAGETMENRPLIAWYLDSRSIAARTRLAQLFGISQISCDDLTAFPSNT